MRRETWMHGRPEPWLERARRDAVLAGDARAWTAWVQEHFDRLAAYVRWRCGGTADLADDALQETWLTAARRLARFDPDRGTFEQWLCGIAVNVIRNLLRARRRRNNRFGPLIAEPPAVGLDGRGEHVAAALAELPERYEEVLRAKYLDGLTVAAIACDRGETEKAVESLLTRAREAFREAFDRQTRQP